jgi:hypothetical protein
VSASPLNKRVRLLNAARYRGLAARTRTLLAQRGWRGMAIGNSRITRRTSLIIYPIAHREAAVRLAAQLGFATAARPTGTEIVVLLGRDAARSGDNA